jgi:hypothetical protein
MVCIQKNVDRVMSFAMRIDRCSQVNVDPRCICPLTVNGNPTPFGNFDDYLVRLV